MKLHPGEEDVVSGLDPAAHMEAKRKLGLGHARKHGSEPNHVVDHG